MLIAQPTMDLSSCSQWPDLKEPEDDNQLCTQCFITDHQTTLRLEAPCATLGHAYVISGTAMQA